MPHAEFPLAKSPLRVIASRPEGGEAISPSHRRLRAWGLRPYSPRVQLRPSPGHCETPTRGHCEPPRGRRSNLTVTSETARVGIAPVQSAGTPSSVCHCSADFWPKQSHRHIGDCARSPRVPLRPFVIASRPEGGEAISPSHRRLRAQSAGTPSSVCHCEPPRGRRSNLTVTSEIARAVRGYAFVRLSLRAAQRAAKQSHRHKGRSIATLASR